MDLVQYYLSEFCSFPLCFTNVTMTTLEAGPVATLYLHWMTQVQTAQVTWQTLSPSTMYPLWTQGEFRKYSLPFPDSCWVSCNFGFSGSVPTPCLVPSTLSLQRGMCLQHIKLCSTYPCLYQSLRSILSLNFSFLESKYPHLTKRESL